MSLTSPWQSRTFDAREGLDFLESFQIPRFGSSKVEVPYNTLVALINAAGGCVVLTVHDLEEADRKDTRVVTYLRDNPSAYVMQVEERQ